MCCEPLGRVIDPELGRDLVSLGMISDLQAENGNVEFTLHLTTPACPLREQLRQMAHQAVAVLPGVQEVRINMDARLPASIGLPSQSDLPGIHNVIAVASGKGGVGKSTVAVNLALGLVDSGARVGLLDADFYGPNIPQMLGSLSHPEVHGDRILPVSAHGLQVMSFDYLVQPGKPLIWRGPLLMGAIQQMLLEVAWKDLDYLVVDLPPGTGDVPLSLVQLVNLAGVVVVTTPQRVAIADVVRCVEMFLMTDAPVLGVVENMSYLICPDCGKQIEIFGRGGGEWLARQFNLPLLGQIPFDPEIREGGDLGQPVRKAESSVWQAFRQLAGKVAGQVSVRQYKITEHM
jgi:ATP-binding protein involved in chromosome partitioning